MVYSGDETCDIGSDTASPVSSDYTSATSHFNGTISWVQLDIGPADDDHHLSPEELFKVAMARQ